VASNFTVDPAELRSHATNLANVVAPAYATSSAAVRTDAQIDFPGFGAALSFLEAGYHQRVDFLAKDLQGAHDVLGEIATRLQQTAAEYQKGENLNIAGFHGSAQHEESYGAALGRTNPLGEGATAAGAMGLTAGVVYATAGSLATCAGLCPTFIPAAVAAALFIANPLSIAEAGAALVNEARHIQTQLNADFLSVCVNSAAKWTGEGKDAFAQLANTIKGHLDQIGKYIETLGGALQSLDITLSTLWLGLAALAGPLLVWLIAMRAAEAIPFAAAAIEPIIEVTGAAATSAVVGTLGGVTAAASAIVALITGLAKDLLTLSALPDKGAAGVPDMTEFSVDTNFSTTL
jgi:hypothetical protein